MCAGCFTHLLADARIRDETATCPNCRCVISKDACSRNLAVEKAVQELPGECRFCSQELPRSLLDKHMTDICEERIVSCRYAPIGCAWNGPHHEAGLSLTHNHICQFICNMLYLFATQTFMPSPANTRPNLVKLCFCFCSHKKNPPRKRRSCLIHFSICFPLRKSLWTTFNFVPFELVIV